MRKRVARKAIPVGVGAVGLCALLWLLWFGWGSPKLEAHDTFDLSTPRAFGLRNFTVFRVDPAGRTVHVDWKGYNVVTGDSFHVPFEEVRLVAGGEEYVVTDRSGGNNQLRVNGEVHRFDGSRSQLLIRFGAGVSVEPGGDYSGALKQYDLEGSGLLDGTRK